MEARAVLKLSASPRRNALEDEGEIALSTPYSSAPSSPRRAFATAEVEEAPLGEVRPAVPFAWELVPGRAKNDLVSCDEAESACHDRGSSSSSSPDGSESLTLSRSSSNTEFEFSSRFVGVVEPLPCRAAEELFSNGQLLPLRLPPRLQAVKNLRNSDSSCSDSVSSSGSFQSYHSPRRSPKKSLSLCGFTTTAEETTILERKQQQRPRPLLLNRESSPHLSSDSVSSASSSSSSETNADSPEDTKGSTLKDLLFTEMAMASMRVGNSKTIGTSRQVQSRRELLRMHQEQWNELVNAQKVDDAAAAPALTPLLSRSNARSRNPIDDRVQSSHKEDVGRAIFANRFGIVCRCMGMALPESP